MSKATAPPITPHSKLRVAVSISLSKEQQDSGLIWSNGAVQNTLFLYYMLRQSPRLGEVLLLNAGNALAKDVPDSLRHGTEPLNIVPLHDGLAGVDVLIEAGIKIGPRDVQGVRERGGKVVAYKVGNDYVIDVESAVFNTRPGGSVFDGSQFDQIWSIPQHMRTCASYWEVAFRCPVIEVPHVWSPMFYRQEAAAVEPEPGYRPGRAKKRIAIFEPNLNVVKSSHYPMLVCESAYRQKPELIDHVFVLSTVQLKEQASFKQFALNLDIVKDNKASFEPRHVTPWFLARYTDVVVTHQWENELNYLYYEVLYGGYPLVHNSSMLRNYGYYFEPFNAQDGARALLEAIQDHDHSIAKYTATAQDLLRKVDIFLPENLARHEALLFALFGC